MDLRHLRIVLTVAESGSISHAAARLQIAQSGLSTQLRRIEQEFGGPLFQRRPQGVVPTELGVHVLGRAEKLLDEFGDLLATARTLARPAEPPQAVALGGVDNPWVPRIAALIRERLPHHEQLTYLEPSSQAVLELLRTEKIALAVVSEFPDVVPPQVRDFTVHDLDTEPALIGLAPGHRLAHRPLLALEELAEDVWIAPGDRSDGLGLSLRIACERAGFTPRFRYFGADQATAAAIVSAGNAVGVFLSPGDHCQGIVWKRLANGRLWRRTRLVWDAGSPLAGLAEDIDRGALDRCGRLAS
ncbi:MULTISPECIES: LysR family transcriptional regulator [Streptomyces]|uniref:DNA-binding transcriptional LysR family regulator n=1 Tax=Streptomyces demainii TaxID=588122 RepID=A0ABT9L4G2_9ACTN|nr:MULTISPECIES: LysR family transcriptional regulator [Streptomyces]MBW8092166.1 LysR family transcriptional regulator [Streptomyces hygroscopicus subsp. hygroscopicus]MCO8302456.1 LysR family transcriptional regulator [Streptomyces sp. RKCA744]MDN3057985.1 LysR family transcriptional regulator [Streptomyces sp. SRF1]MDP9615586.1 DNA-binding transcriptional LysR family regulator [Streptomyces demainii]